jgi:hypothetical protein
MPPTGAILGDGFRVAADTERERPFLAIEAVELIARGGW